MMLEGDLTMLRDEELLARLRDLAAFDRRTSAAIIAHLGEVERRGLHLSMGNSSMFAYCREVLGFSRDVAYKRIKVARMARECPEVVGHLASGALSVASAMVLTPVAREPGGRALINEALGRSRREVEELVVARFPDRCSPRGELDRVRVLADGRCRLEVTIGVDASVMDELLERARAVDPQGGNELGAMVHAAIEAWVSERERRRFAQARSPQKHPRPTSTRDHIPAQLRREVFARDGGCCAFVGESGKRCESRHQLEIDHVVPLAAGGLAVADNLRLLCRAHNRHAAREVLGREQVDMGKRHRETRNEMRNRRVKLSSAPTSTRSVSRLESEIEGSLKRLGFMAIEAREAVKRAGLRSEHDPARAMTLALRALGPPKGVKVVASVRSRPG